MHLEKEFKEAPEEIEDLFIEHLKKRGYFLVAGIDVQGIIKKNFSTDIGFYKIFDVCKPLAARELISIDDRIGLYLPCKVTLNAKNGKSVLRLLLIYDIATRETEGTAETLKKYQDEIESLFNDFVT